MEYEIELAKWKWIWIKDMDLHKVYIWVNWSAGLWIKLLESTEHNMKIRIWDWEQDCYLWSSTSPVRGGGSDSSLVNLMVDINPELTWALLTNDLTLIIE